MAREASKSVVQDDGAPFEVGGVLYVGTEEGALVSGLSGDQAEVRIPEVIDGSPVVGVEDAAFAGCGLLESLTLPSTVIKIGGAAFRDCVGLREMELPQSLERISPGTFEGCTALQTVVLPYHLKSIGARAFAGCVSLETIGYFSKRGISARLFTDRTLFQEAFPEEITEFGESAFAGCASLVHVDMPHRVTGIPAHAFANCAHLTEVGLHSDVRKIGERAFAGCPLLLEVRVPPGCKDIASDAFPSTTVLVVGQRSPAWSVLEPQADAVNVRFAADTPRVRSGLGLGVGRFYSDEQLEEAKDSMELRPLRFERYKRLPPGPEPGNPSRFVHSTGTYRAAAPRSPKAARIMMVGDVMAASRRQELAQVRGDRVFSEAFRYVEPLLKESDFAVCNLETMLSPSAPYSSEQKHVASRPHLNAPPSFASALRGAGFDAVVNAQNHAYDAGLEGMYETLDVLNKAQLIHTGLFASLQDDRFLLLDIAGIKVGLVSFMDRARQAMKRNTFTPAGARTLLPFLTEEEVWLDIHAARTAGAEFVIAYCHWGREYTEEVTARQWGFGAMVAEAGADYIVGAHPHCLQAFEILKTSDDREVPCLWSAGNFVAEMNTRAPITRDTLILDLELQRINGEVAVSRNVYHPCRIMRLKVRDSEHPDARNYFTVPTNTRLRPARLNRLLQEAEQRIARVIGPSLQAFGD